MNANNPKPKINNVELNGNKTLQELGIPTKTSELENDSDYAKKSDIPNVDNFITKEVEDLLNYYNKSEIDSMIGDIESVLNEVV